MRSRDVLEHIERVLTHVRRLESSAETAVQMHFSAQSHRTNSIMRTLTVLTAIFLPLNLVTGFFGMNFEGLPLIHSATGFWLVAGIMLLLGLGPERVLLAQALPEHRAADARRRFSHAAARACSSPLTLVWGLNWPVMKLGVTRLPAADVPHAVDVDRACRCCGWRRSALRVPLRIAAFATGASSAR